MGRNRTAADRTAADGTRLAKRLAIILLSLVVVVAFSACGDDDDSASDDTTTTSAASDDGDSGCPSPVDEAAATEAITAALNNFLEQPEPEDKITTIDNGEAILDVLTESTERLAGANPSVTSFSVVVEFQGDTDATYTFDLQAQANPGVGLGLSQAGAAVCVDGEWLITADTVCDLTALGDEALGTECLNALS